MLPWRWIFRVQLRRLQRQRLDHVSRTRQSLRTLDCGHDPWVAVQLVCACWWKASQDIRQLVSVERVVLLLSGWFSSSCSAVRWDGHPHILMCYPDAEVETPADTAAGDYNFLESFSSLALQSILCSHKNLMKSLEDTNCAPLRRLSILRGVRAGGPSTSGFFCSASWIGPL